MVANSELALHKAVRHCPLPVVAKVLAAFPRAVKQRSYPLDNMTPLELARERGDAQIVEVVLAAKKAVDADFKAYVANLKPPA